jgi:hypothetical protein
VLTIGWVRSEHSPAWTERLLCVPAAALLLYLNPTTIAIGAGLLSVALVVHLVAARGRPPDSPGEQRPPDLPAAAVRA